MNKETFIMMLMQKVAQEPNDQALGEWVRKMIWNLKLEEGQSPSASKLLRD